MTKQENNDNRHRPTVPPLRFRGFTAPWQRKRLGDITIYSKGKGYSKNDLKDEGVPVILYGSLYTDYRSEINDVNTFTETSDGATLSRGGEVIVPASGETAEDIARASVVKAVNTIIGGDLNIIYPDSVIDSLFLALEITYGQCHDALVKKAQGTSVIHLRSSDIEDVDCSFPSIAEQEKIGTFFRALDELIAAREEELEKLHQMKAALLDAMFPNDVSVERVTSATAHTLYDSLLDHTLREWDIVPTEPSTPHTPRLRFRGFTDPWQRTQLGELLSISTLKNTDEKYTREQVLSVSDDYGVTNQIKLLGRSYAGSSVQNYKVLEKGDIVYTKSPLRAKPYGIIKENNEETGIVSILYAIYKAKDNCSPSFIHYYFAPEWRINAYLRPLVNIGAKNTMNISDEEALTGILSFPSLAEQKQIGAFFRSQDEGIATATEQIDKLKRIKQACLKQMFV